MSCLFCKIANKEIPSQLLFEDDDLIAFRDIAPAAKVHCLIIPKKHFSNLNELDETHNSLLGKLLQKAKHLASQLGIDQSGYRCVINTNKDGGQTVFHLHLHLIGGETLSGKMA